MVWANHFQVSFITYGIASIIGVHYGTGKHRADLATYNLYKARRCWWYCYLFYCLAMIASKLFIGCFLLRIAVRRLHVYVIYMAMLISVGGGATFFFVVMLQCKPVSFFWNKPLHGTCISNGVIVALGYAYSASSIITDFTFAMLPILLVLTLQTKRKTKLAPIPLLTMGCM